jgi:hypothetical protein
VLPHTSCLRYPVQDTRALLITISNNVLQQWARLARAVLCTARDDRDHLLQALVGPLNYHTSARAPAVHTILSTSVLSRSRIFYPVFRLFNPVFAAPLPQSRS